MESTPALVLVSALALTACTDQPLPPEPTASVSNSPEASETAMTDEVLTANIAEVLEHPEPADLLTGDAAAEAFTALLLSEPANDGVECPPVAENFPKNSGFGQVTDSNDEDEEESQSLGAFVFPSADEAEAFTPQLQDFVKGCTVLEAEIAPLTHHTEDAFEMQIERSDDTASSVVVLRDENIVLVSSSTPAADVALSLTLTDQLQEMLR